MKITAAESKGADSGPPGMGLGRKPGRCDGIQVKRAFFDIQVRVLFLGFQGRRYHLVVQGQRGLDQTGRACRSLGVTDHGFNGPQGAFAWHIRDSRRKLGENLF